MPAQGPPARYRGAPNKYTLNAGEQLWRVHSRSYPADKFNFALSDEVFGGGRFDGTKADPYGYYYASGEQATALAEAFLRDELRFNEWGYRMLQRRFVKGRRISAVETLQPLTLVSLRTGPDLAAAAVSTKMVQGGSEYSASRAIARWLRVHAPWAQGLIWTSTIDLGKPSVVLFADRCSPGVLRQLPRMGGDLDSEDGIDWLNEALAPYHAQIRQIRPPRRPERGPELRIIG